MRQTDFVTSTTTITTTTTTITRATTTPATSSVGFGLSQSKGIYFFIFFSKFSVIYHYIIYYCHSLLCFCLTSYSRLFVFGLSVARKIFFFQHSKVPLMILLEMGMGTLKSFQSPMASNYGIILQSKRTG